MLLERTISQLDIGSLPVSEANQLGHLGYMQWLAALPADCSYRHAAEYALRKARPFGEVSPAVAVFCNLLQQSLDQPLRPLPLSLPQRKRRGGARGRRSNRAPL